MLVFASIAFGAPATAQAPPPLALRVNTETGGLEMRLGNLFDDPSLVRALYSGLSLRIQVEAELWKDGFFDSQRGRGDWRATVVFDPLEERYRVATGGDAGVELSVDLLSEAGEALRTAFAIPLRPYEAGRYYYLGQVEIETLSLSDLEGLQRWLRGGLATASGGDEPAGSAMGRGLHRMLVRVLGIPARRYRVRTERFDFEAREPT